MCKLLSLGVHDIMICWKLDTLSSLKVNDNKSFVGITETRLTQFMPSCDDIVPLLLAQMMVMLCERLISLLLLIESFCHDWDLLLMTVLVPMSLLVIYLLKTGLHKKRLGIKLRKTNIFERR